MDKLLLSICIPSYNRATYLYSLLESIQQLPILFPYEVRIQDNNSSDNTAEIAMSFCKSNANWYYEKNEYNVGGIKNIRRCTENALGEYIWIVGDDDLLVDDAFEKIIDSINSIKNYPHASILFNQQLGQAYSKCSTFKDGFDWIKKIAINVPAFISSILWKKQFWLNYDYAECIKAFYLPQLHCFFETCLKSLAFGVSKELVIRRQAENTSQKTYWFFHYHALVDCFEYPYLYKIILHSTHNYKIKVITYLRIIKFLPEIRNKINFMKKNSEYEVFLKRIQNEYKNLPLGYILKLFLF